MPPTGALDGIPTVTDPPGGEGHDTTTPSGVSIAAKIANLLQGAATGLTQPSKGIYIGDGLPPVPPKLAAKIQKGEFVDMGELLPEFWATAKDDEGAKPDLKSRRGRKVTDIFTWVQCYASYTAVVAGPDPSRIPELMAYLKWIVCLSQDFAGLAWVRYDAAFRRQAALTGNWKWSQINATLYSMCFTGMARSTTRCELCMATTHTEKDCALQGTNDPGLTDRLKTLESLVVAMSPQSGKVGREPTREPSGEPCRLWNQDRCTYPKCRHSHVCSRCGGHHRVMQCPTPGQRAGPSHGLRLENQGPRNPRPY